MWKKVSEYDQEIPGLNTLAKKTKNPKTFTTWIHLVVPDETFTTLKPIIVSIDNPDKLYNINIITIVPLTSDLWFLENNVGPEAI